VCEKEREKGKRERERERERGKREGKLNKRLLQKSRQVIEK